MKKTDATHDAPPPQRRRSARKAPSTPPSPLIGSKGNARKAAVPDESLDAFDALGERIRKIRRSRGLSLAQLAPLCEISVAMLSHIERGRTDPSLKSLDRIRQALDVPMTRLFPHSADDEMAGRGSPVVRAGNRELLRLGDIGLVKYKLSPTEDSDLEVLLIVLEPGGSSGKEPWARVGEKAGLIVRGRLELDIAGEVFDLAEGDSFQFDSSKPHRFANPGTEVAEMVWIIKSSPLVRQMHA